MHHIINSGLSIYNTPNNYSSMLDRHCALELLIITACMLKEKEKTNRATVWDLLEYPDQKH